MITVQLLRSVFGQFLGSGLHIHLRTPCTTRDCNAPLITMPSFRRGNCARGE